MSVKKHFFLYTVIFFVIVIFVSVARHFAESAEDELFFYCGAGLRPVIDEVVPLFTEETGVQVRIDYNASSLLLGRIQVSRFGDLFMPGDIHYIDKARDEDLIDQSWKVAAFVPVILVGEGNPKNIHSLHDLTGEGIKLGLADERTAAIGRTARLLMTANNIEASEYEQNLVFDSVTVHELATAVKLGSIDAAIVWEPIARQLEQAETVEIPPENNVVAPVPIAILSVSGKKEQARQFVDFILSETAMEVFRRHDYGDPADY